MSLRRGIALSITAALVGFLGGAVGPALAVGQSCTSVSPANVVQGVNNQTLHLAGSYPAPTGGEVVTITPATGITIVSTTKVSTSLIDIVVNVAPDAPATNRVVAVSHTATSESCDNPLTVGPDISAVGGAVSNAGPSGSITITGRAFQSGASVELIKTSYGFGGAESDTAAATAVNVVSPTQITATVPTQGRAPGLWRVKVINPDGGTFTFGDGVTTGQTITGGQPTLLTITPTGIAQGVASKEYAVTGTNLARGLEFTFSGAGVTQSAATTWESLSSVKVKLSAAVDAAPGARNVTLTNTDDQTSTATGALLVSAPPSISGATPASIGQGAAAVPSTVTGTGFQSGAALSYSGVGVTATVASVSPTSISATVDAAQDAATGARDLTVTNPDGGTATRTGALNIVTGPKATSVSPPSRPRGVTVTIDINGTFPANPMEVLFSPAPGITVQGTPTRTDTKVTATIVIAPDAPAGPRNVIVRDTTTKGQGTCIECFAVNGAPTISTIDPTTVGQGASNFTLTITGTNFLAGPAVTFSGTGVNSTSVVRDSPTQLTVNVSVTDTATPGSRDVTVTNTDGGAVTKPAGLTVAAGPKITTLDPPGRPQGFTGAFVINGSGYATAPVVVVSGTGVTINSVTRDSATKLTVGVTVSPTATLAARDVTVTNPDGGRVVCTGCFAVAKGPTLTSITPTDGSGGGTVSITDLKGTDFQATPAVQLEQSEQAPVPMTNVSRVSSTKVTGTFDLTNARPGRWSVRLTNPDGGSALLPNAFNVVLGAPTVTEVVPTNVAQTTTGLKMTIKGTGFAPGLAVTLPNADGATLTEVVRISTTVIEAKISVDDNAPLGSRDVRVTNADNQAGECTACFFVIDGAQSEVMSNFNAYGPYGGGGFVAAGDVDADPGNGAEVVTGANGGGGPHVKLYRINPDTGAEHELFGFHAYNPAFTGGVRVAVGEIDGDTTNGSEIVTAAGPGGGPHVRIFKVGADLSLSEPLGGGFMAYGDFGGGVYVAAGDINGDGRDEIITGAGPGGGPHVRIMSYDPVSGSFVQMAGFYAFDPSLGGGVAVAAGDVVPEESGPVKLEAIAAPASGGGPHVKLFNENGAVVSEFMAFSQSYTDGLRLAAGDLNFDSVDDVITAKAKGSEVAMWSNEDPYALLIDPPPSIYGSNSISGTNVASYDMDGDGDDDLVTTPDHDSPVILRVNRPV